MASKKPKENDASLPFAALQLLAPPVRLVSAALWKVMKQRDVMQYGIVEEFVTSACETVPGLLTVRHQGKLALGLRARLILELCSTKPDKNVIMPHLERIRAPAALSVSSGPTGRRDVKIVRTVESFHSLVHTLLTDPAEREQFLKDEFPVDYGPSFDQELEKLLWEFLIRLDQLLPAPNLAQTVSWLTNAPPVLEECARAATQPQLLKTLLQHQTCLGHLEPAASLPPNMGDSILASLSLPPSGRVPSNQATGAKNCDGVQTRDETPFIAPVIGLISNEDVPVMISASKRTPRDDDETSENSKDAMVRKGQNSKDDDVKEGGEQREERNDSKRSCGVKRKQAEQSESDEDEKGLGMIPSGKKRMSTKQGRRNLGMVDSEDKGAETVRNEEGSRAALERCMTQLGIKKLRLPEDPNLCSIFVSCLSRLPSVVVEKMSVTPASANRDDQGEKSSNTKQQDGRRRSPVKAPRQKSTSNQPQTPDSDFPGLDDKENHPLFLSASSSPSTQHRNTATLAISGDGEEYVADSEDEATKNFKGRLFTKRYYKTKHGTYVPTLREYWKPTMAQRNVTSARSKRR